MTTVRWTVSSGVNTRSVGDRLGYVPLLSEMTFSSQTENAILLMAFLAQTLKEWGIPSPGVTQGALIYAGYQLSIAAYLNGFVIAGAVFLGFIVGSVSLYILCRYTEPWVTKYLNRFLRLKPQQLENLKIKLSTFRWWTVMGSRFIPAFMAPMTIVAGLVKFPPKSFFLGIGLAMLAWTCFFGGAGYIFGNVILTVLGPNYLNTFSLILFFSLSTGFVFWLIHRPKVDEVTNEIL